MPKKYSVLQMKSNQICEKNNEVVSLVKACGIILMVLLHSFTGGVCNHISNFFGVYHMPLFLIMSGFCFKDKYVNDVRSYIKGRVRGVWWPYVKYGVLFILLHNVFFRLNFINDQYGYPTNVYSWKEIVSQSVMTLFFLRRETLLGGYWFLEALFGGSLIFFFFKKCGSNCKINILVLFLLSVLLKILSGNDPYGGRVFLYFYSAFFINIGHCIRQGGWHIYFSNPFFIIICFVLVGVDSCLFPRAMLNVDIERLFPSAISAIIGTCATYGVCEIIIRSGSYKWIKYGAIYIGNNTLQILTWHLLFFKITSLVIIIVYNLPIEQLASFPTIYDYSKIGWWISYTLIGVFLPMVILFIYEGIKKELQTILQCGE